MDIGLALPHYEYSFGIPGTFDVERMIAVARDADAGGFASLWISDHLSLDLAKYGGPADPFATVEPIAMLGALARATTSARLGTLVALEALRPAALLAKSFTTIDRLSAGRAVLGLGAGWYEPDYTEIGMNMPAPRERVGRLAEALEVLQSLFRSGPMEPVSAGGASHSAVDAVLTPRPWAERRIPIVVGGKGDRVLDLSVQYADGWNACWVWTPETYAERLAVHDAACERHGVDPEHRYRSVGLYALIGESEADLRARFERLRGSIPGVLDGVTLDDWRVGRLVGTVEQVREQLAGWEALGVDEIILGLGCVPFHLGDADDLHVATALIDERQPHVTAAGGDRHGDEN